MKHVIIGTAGHVDHGKTTLIRALTHIETDRLKEEQQRGISIEIGFAYFDLPSGRRAGLIDVPGHERFIKNMLAGVGGLDVVILVIAADEGIMPQTREHLNIVSLLQVKRGIVALTKADMVDKEWLDFMQEEIREQLSHTFLADAAIIPVSGVTGLGLEELTLEIDRLTEEVAAKDSFGSARLPIDRVFTISGFGTVVTGTLISGSLTTGDKMEIMPNKLDTRIRSIQVHGQKVNHAYAGQRVAVNLSGVDVSDLHRGHVLCNPGSLQTTLMLDARLQVLPDAVRAVEHRTRIRLYIGTTEVMGRVVPLEQDQIQPGESGLVQLRLEEPIAAAEGDLFILRYYSPMTTLGGGSVIQTNPKKKTRHRIQQVEALRIMEKGSPEHRLLQMLHEASPAFPTREDFLKAHPEFEDADALLEEILQKEQAVTWTVDKKEIIISAAYLQEIYIKMEETLDRFHKKNPLRLGMAKEELRSRVLNQVPSRVFVTLLMLLESDEKLRNVGNVVALPDFKIALNQEQDRLYRAIKERYETSGFEPPGKTELQTEYNKSKDLLPVLDLLLEEQYLVRLTEEMYYPKHILEKTEQMIYQWFEQNSEISLAEFRDLIQSSRKYALVLIEYFDSQKVTQRQGEKRVLRRKG
jgi:selenocysteine-specific elongation factor